MIRAIRLERPAKTLSYSRRCAVALGVCAAFLVTGAGGAPAATQSVAPTDLGTLGGSFSLAYGVNASRQVVGVSSIAGDTESHAFSWTQADGMVDLGTLGGTYSEADGVNDNGMVVGKAALSGDATRHAFVWTQADGMVDLGTLGGSYSEAYAVNSSGQVIGIAATVDDAATHAFSWTQADGMVDLGTLGGNSSVLSCCLGHNVSDNGHVVGQSHTAGNTALHAFLWTQGDGMVDIGTLPGGNFSIAYAVNASGQVVGQSSPPEYEAFSWTQADGFVDLGRGAAEALNASGQVVGGRRFASGDHAFSWTQSGGIVDIGTLGGSYSQAVAVNADGQAVGVSYTAGDAAQHGFSWTEAGGIVDLDALGGSTSRAQAMNEAGQVVGWASTAGDQETHAALWEIPADTAAPMINCDSADGLWHANDVTIACTAEDSGSGLADPGDASFSLTTSVPADTETADAATGTHEVCDNAANCATAGPVSGNRVDKKSPQVTCGTADGVWHAANVSIGCTATDGGSGLSSAGDASFSLATSVPAGTETATAQTGSRVVQDQVGNSNTAGPIGGNKVDRRAPTITVTTPPQNANYIFRQPVAANYGCTDGGSGVQACTGTVANGANVPTSTPGAQTFTVTGSDNVGNAAPAVTRNYTVTFTFQGFTYPQNQPVINVVQAGRITPSRFNLFDYFGVTIFNTYGTNIFAGSPTSAAVTCPSGSTYNATQTTTAGLRYDTANRRYEYGFATSTSWAGTCRILTLKFKDGTQRRLTYRFR